MFWSGETNKDNTIQQVNVKIIGKKTIASENNKRTNKKGLRPPQETTGQLLFQHSPSSVTESQFYSEMFDFLEGSALMRVLVIILLVGQ